MRPMNVFIALYRGINVGGRNLVKMPSLLAMHAALGHQNAKSYVQSGNVVFRAHGSAASIARDTAAAFAEQFGHAVKLMVRSADQWDQLVAGNPFAKPAAKDPRKVHAGICDGSADQRQLAALLAKTCGPERFVVMRGIVYLHAPDGLGRSKFAAGMERAAGVPMTLRNWRTVEALQALARALS
jgi:uncharacterized protein (DUF1697 family)